MCKYSLPPFTEEQANALRVTHPELFTGSPWERAMGAMREDELIRNGGKSQLDADIAEMMQGEKDRKSDEEFAKSALHRECVRSMNDAALKEGVV